MTCHGQVTPVRMTHITFSLKLKRYVGIDDDDGGSYRIWNMVIVVEWKVI